MRVWWHELVWVAGAGIVGFSASTIFAGWLELSRSWFVLAYASMTLPLVVGYVRWSGIDVVALVRHRWVWGLVGGGVVGALVVMSVLRQDSSARPEGFDLAFDLVWLGVAYGVVDALLLNVLPVLATWRALSARGWTTRWRGRIAAGILAIFASVLVTLAYHVGFPEYRDGDIAGPVIGDVVSVGYLLTNNPLTALVSHVAMHVAAVLHGAEGTAQLPPHY
jgi:hypothetical protein